MLRRRGAGGGGREGDIGLADVAIAVLGPVALMWIVFMASAAINSEPRCEELKDAEVQARAAQLRHWYAAEQREFIRLGETWRKSCGGGRPLRASGSPGAGLIPASLQGVCSREQTRILDKAGLSSGSFAQLAAQKAALANALAACTGSCVKAATALDRRRLATDLKAWYDARGKELTEMKSALGRDCPLVKVDAVPKPSHRPSVPPAIADLCGSDRTAVVREAGLKDDAIELQEKQIGAVLSTYFSCVQQVSAGCRKDGDLKKVERNMVLADLQAWYRDLLEGVRGDQKLLEAKSCPTATAIAPTAYATSVEPLRRHKICHASDTQLVREAGLATDDIARLLKDRALLDVSLRECVGTRADSGCQWLDQGKLTEAARKLSSWHATLRARMQEDEKLAERYCDRPTGPAPKFEPMSVPLLRSLRVCHAQWSSVLELAKTSERDIDALLARHAAIMDKLRGCVANETATRIERSIKFIVCTTRFTQDDKHPQKEMEPAEVEEVFDRIARRVLKDLDAAVRPYTRIEVRGHTDAAPIGAKGCEDPITGVRTRSNALLSSLRAHRFNEELLRAMERLAGKQEDAASDAAARMLARFEGYVQELKGPAKGVPESEVLLARIEPHYGRAPALRLYAIGVGSDEPAYKRIEDYQECSLLKDEEQHRVCRYQIDRRIEFRFVHEPGSN